MRPLIIDTNLLVLLVVGLSSKNLIGLHKRLRAYSVSDFDLLLAFLKSYSPIVICPNVWTEASNIARQIPEPSRRIIGVVMGNLMESSQEVYVVSSNAAKRSEFLDLGLADAAMLEISPKSTPILTSDLGLYLAAQRQGREAVNFNHIREANRE